MKQRQNELEQRTNYDRQNNGGLRVSSIEMIHSLSLAFSSFILVASQLILFSGVNFSSSRFVI